MNFLSLGSLLPDNFATLLRKKTNTNSDAEGNDDTQIDLLKLKDLDAHEILKRIVEERGEIQVKLNMIIYFRVKYTYSSNSFIFITKTITESGE